MAANHATYLTKNNTVAGDRHIRDVGDKVVDSHNYIVAPCRDSLWSSFTGGDRGAAARVNQRLNGWCDEYELFRIDDLLLTKEEKEACAIEKNPYQLKYERFHRLFPTG